jgi:hypothetical protein
VEHSLSKFTASGLAFSFGLMLWAELANGATAFVGEGTNLRLLVWSLALSMGVMLCV